MTVEELIQYVGSGNAHEKLQMIYQTEAEVTIQQARYERALKEFYHAFSGDTAFWFDCQLYFWFNCRNKE